MNKNNYIVENALIFSAEAYKGKVHKISKKPYIAEICEVVSVMAAIDPRDKDLMASAALINITDNTDVTYDDIEKEFGTRIKNILISASAKDADSIRKLPLKIKMLILADKTAELRCLTREYSTYNERIWSDLLGEDPKVLAKYYYDLNNSFFEFEEYDIYSEFERLVARLFVRHR
ncbi:MAG: HD domain-containing protein [Firmicutes bacterium]|nr:HD domain-containing protein [Bacillota bacterium]